MNSNDERRYNRRDDDQQKSRGSDRNDNRRHKRDQFKDQAEFASGHSESTDREDYSQSNDNWRARHNREFGQYGGDRPEHHQNENRNYHSTRESPDNYQEHQNYGRGGYNNRSDQDPRYGDPRYSDRERRGSSGRSSDEYERGSYGNYPIYGSSGEGYGSSRGGYGSQTRNRGNDRGRFDQSRYEGGQQDGGSNWEGRAGAGSHGQGSYGDSGFSQRQSHRGKGPKNYERSDSRIKDDVNDALYDHHDIDASDIEVEVNGGIVVLQGEVSSRNEKRDAETAIDYISGVQNVENRLHIKSHHNRGRSGSDSEEDNTRKDAESFSASKTKNGKQ